MTLHGLPLAKNTPVSSGMVLVFADTAFRLTVEGHEPTPTLLDDAEEFAADLQSGWLEVEHRDGFRHATWRGDRTPARLADFAKTVLARSLKSLRLELMPAQDLERMAEALGPLVERTTFAVPAVIETERAFRVEPLLPGSVWFDERHLDLSSPAWLVATQGRCGLTRTASPAPMLSRLPSGVVVLSFELGWGPFESIQLEGHEFLTAARKGLQVCLRPNESVVVSTRTTSMQLTIREAGLTGVEAPLETRDVQRLRLDHQTLEHVFLYGAGEVLEFTQSASDGLFKNARVGDSFFVENGRLRWVNRPALEPFGLLDVTWLAGAERIVLPAPSPFLSGARPWPTPLSREGAMVFVDELLADGDGASEALRALIACNGAPEQDEWFRKLMVSPLRGTIGAWLSTERGPLASFAALQRVTPQWRPRVEAAICAEPVLQFIERLA